MKRLPLLSSLLSLLALLVAPLAASADGSWSLQVYAPQSPSNTSSVNIEYKVLSIYPHDFAVNLYMDGSLTAIKHTEVAGDPNTNYGNSGDFSVTLPNGNHSFYITAVNQDKTTDTESSGPTNLDIDTSTPPAPVYKGKTQSGNTYFINFAAPNSTDVSVIKVFGSTSKTYTANSSTYLGQVSVSSANQNFSFGYTAPDSNARYFAVQSFDAAGNQSSLVGDPGTTVNPVVAFNGGAVAAAQTAAATPVTTASSSDTSTSSNPTGQVQGANTNSTNGEVNAPGASTSKNNGKVLGLSTTVKNSNGHKTWYVSGAIALAAILLVTWLFLRRRKLSRTGDV